MPKSRSRRSDRRRPYAAPPPKRRPKASPKWYGFLVLGLMLIGVMMIVLNYMGIMPGDTRQLWLWLGLGFIAGGFVAATQWR
jgi:hypothetical protein